MLRGNVEGEMVLLSEGSSVKESLEDKQVCAPCVRGSAKISRRVTLALYTGLDSCTALHAAAQSKIVDPGRGIGECMYIIISLYPFNVRFSIW